MLKMFKKKSKKDVKNSDSASSEEPVANVEATKIEEVTSPASVVEIESTVITEPIETSIQQTEASVQHEVVAEQPVSGQPIAINLKESEAALVDTKAKYTPCKIIFTALLVLFFICVIFGTGLLLFGVYIASIWS